MANRNLQAFQNRLKVDVMVPLGSHALMPGYLYHTNELLIGKPSGIFIEATTSQAMDIVNRRIRVANQRLKDLEVESEFLNNKLEYSQRKDVFSHEDQKEIIEEYDEEAEKHWRVAHRQKVREAKLKERAERHKNVPDEDFNALMETLDELEMMEELEEEFNEIVVPDPLDMSGQVAFTEKPRTSYELESFSTSGEDMPTSNDPTPSELSIDFNVEESRPEPVKRESKRKSLQFSEDLEKVKLIHKMDRPNTLITRYDPEKTLQVTFKHSPLEFHPPKVASSETIGSPGDIYNMFQHCLKHGATPEEQPKSILKKTDHVIHVNKSAKLISFEDGGGGDQDTAPIENIYQQVVGDVLERNSSVQSGSNGQESTDNVQVQGESKRVSRFKAMRS